jgi:hypothetical protein
MSAARKNILGSSQLIVIVETILIVLLERIWNSDEWRIDYPIYPQPLLDFQVIFIPYKRFAVLQAEKIIVLLMRSNQDTGIPGFARVLLG